MPSARTLITRTAPRRRYQLVHPKHWKRRAQANPYAVAPLVIIPAGEKYCTCAREGADEAMRFVQEWTFRDVGATFRTVPAVTVYGDKTAAEYTQSNIHYDIADQLRRTVRYDAGRERIELCNWKRLYVLFTVGQVHANAWGVMSGRQASGLSCPDDLENPLRIGGPGRVSATASLGMDIVMGHAIDPSHPLWSEKVNDPRGYYYGILGSIAHDIGHSLGINPDRAFGHPTEAEDGPMAWFSPMGGLWFFNTTDGHGTRGQFLPREREFLKGTPFFR